MVFVWVVIPLSMDFLDIFFPSNEALLEAVTCPDRPWDDLHHLSYFLAKLHRVEHGEFYSIMLENENQPMNPSA